VHSLSRKFRIKVVVAAAASGLLCAGLHAGTVPSMEMRQADASAAARRDFIGAVDASRPIAFYRLNALTGDSRGGRTQYRTLGGVTIERSGAPLKIANNSYARLDGHDGYILTTQAGGIGTAASMMAWVNLATLPSDAKRFFYVIPDGHFKFPHLWPVKIPQAGRADYESWALLRASREAASLRR
jgi:hypothetical protein